MGTNDDGGAVLITVEGGTVDYYVNGQGVKVVMLNFDELSGDDAFPADVEAALEEVRTLPPMIPWLRGIERRLGTLRTAAKERIRSGPRWFAPVVPTLEGSYEDN